MSSWSLVKKEPDSCERLDRIARRLLRAAEVGDRLPTPQDDIIDCAELVVGGEIDLDAFKDTFFNKLGRALCSGWQKLRGILDVRERTIYIKDDVPESQKPFLRFHEVAHKIIPWQEKMYHYFGDHWETLCPDVRELFEKEANYLSARLLFQCDRLEKEGRDYELSLATGIKFAQDYGASYHSTLWHYVETHSSKCVLLVLREAQYHVVGENESEKPYCLRYVVPSKHFKEEFGDIPWHREFNPEHPFTAVVYDPHSPDIHEGSVELENQNCEKVVMNFQAWCNTYNIFVLIYKKPRRSLRKWRVAF